MGVIKTTEGRGRSVHENTLVILVGWLAGYLVVQGLSADRRGRASANTEIRSADSHGNGG